MVISHCSDRLQSRILLSTHEINCQLAILFHGLQGVSSALPVQSPSQRRLAWPCSSLLTNRTWTAVEVLLTDRSGNLNLHRNEPSRANVNPQEQRHAVE